MLDIGDLVSDGYVGLLDLSARACRIDFSYLSVLYYWLNL